jgi:peptidoglycan/LPS O-acetylase OafA/YrhL
MSSHSYDSSVTAEEAALLQKYNDTPPRSSHGSPKVSLDINESGDGLLGEEYKSTTPARRGIRGSMRGFLRLLIPSFWHRNVFTATQSDKSSPTAYLDGVRGLSSFFVFIHHYPMDYYRSLHNGFASGPDQKLFLKLPFVRIIYSGRFMVTIFFLLSGFVLAYKPLKHVRAGQTASLVDVLASSILRRGFRLFLPMIIPTFIGMLCIHMGWYRSLDPIVPVPAILPLFMQINEWWHCLLEIMNPFSWGTYSPPYATQLWTLPYEFRGSMLVFLTVLGLSRTKEAIRVIIGITIAIYGLWNSHWDVFLFLTGMVLAELQLIRLSRSPSLDKVPETKPRWQILLRRSFWIANFIISIFLGCWPDNYSEISPGYRTLSKMVPAHYKSNELQQRWWTSIAAVQMLMAIEHLPAVQAFFTKPLMKYLGDISYALYIVHIPILYSFGRWFTVHMIMYAGADNNWGFNTGFFLGALVVTPVVFWAADLCWRGADIKSVQFARWFAMKCTLTRSDGRV